MSKDGTYRGGRRVRAGDKPKPAADRLAAGERIKVMVNDIPDLDVEELEAVDLPDGAVLEGSTIPKPDAYLSARQKNGKPLGANIVYEETYKWLKARHCENLVNKRQVELYAQAFARYVQCEDAISTYGLLGKHPTTGGVIASPFVTMSQQFLKTANLCWYEIFDIVKANSTQSFETDPNDTMEQLLRARRD